MRTSKHSLSSQRGAVLIHVAVALLALIAFSTFVVDYGIMWVGRGQAQTAADAGALSGALTLAFEGTTAQTAAKEKARVAAIANPVFGQAPDVQLTDVTFPACPPGTPGIANTCVKVNAFRNQARGNPLPTFFGKIVNVASQGVRATAMAQVLNGNATTCLRPWSVVDRWDEWAPGAEPDYPNPDPDFNATSTYDKYEKKSPEADLYVPPSASSPGTGYTVTGDWGKQFAVKTGPTPAVSSGWFQAIKLARTDGGGNGANVYRENIRSCNGYVSSYAQPATVCPNTIGNDDRAYWGERGCFEVETGNMSGPTSQGVGDLIAQDPGASWGAGGVINSSFAVSPRIVPVGVINIDAYLAQNPSGGGGVVRMSNIFGFFIEGMGIVNADGSFTLKASGDAVIGRLTTVPAITQGGGSVDPAASFLKQVALVR